MIKTCNTPKLMAGAGAAVIEITADILPTDGFCGVHDLPHVRVLVLDCVRRAAIVAAEMVNVPNDMIQATQKMVSQITGTPEDCVWVHVTHAITTPHFPFDPAKEKGKGGPPPRMRDPEGPRKRAALEKVYLAAVEQASRQAAVLRPAKLGIGTGYCNVNINRDVETPYGWWIGFNPEGLSNKTATVLRFDDEKGIPIGMFISYGLKPCAIDNSEMDKGTRLISSDVPGLACTLLEKRYGAPCLFAMSAAGDQVPRQQAWGEMLTEDGKKRFFDYGVQKGLQIVDELGHEMADDMVSIIETINCNTDCAEVSLGRTAFQWPTRGRVPRDPAKEARYTPEGEYEVTAELLVLGDVALAAVKPEVNACTEQELQKDSPYPHTLLLSMVNGGFKYMPDQASYEKVTWEATSSGLLPGAAEAWVGAAAKVLVAMKEGTYVPFEGPRPQVTVVGEARPDGERIARVEITFPDKIPDVNAITVRDRNIVERKVDGNLVTLVLNEADENSIVIPQYARFLKPDDPNKMRPSGPNGPKKRPALPSCTCRPVQISVNIPGWGELVSDRVKEPVIDQFVRGIYRPLSYNLFTPHKEEGKKYPMLIFIPDAGANGSDPKAALAQGIGATVWATPEEQAKHPCYVLAVQVPSSIHLTYDDYHCAPELSVVEELIDKIIAENDVDINRIYVTGQSQGCMAFCELNWMHPEKFAASMLVAAHWDSEKMTSLTDGKFFFTLSSGGLKEYPNFNAITAGLAEKGVKVNRIHLNFRDGWEVNNARVAAVAPANAQVVYAVFDKETAFPDDGMERAMMRHHNRGWELGYQLESARDWLFAQHR